MEQRPGRRDSTRALTVKPDVRDNRIPVTPEMVKEWAEGTIGEWFPGYTDFDEKANTQFRITHSGENTYTVEAATGMYGISDPRTFTITVTVQELT